jgi:hypothetical protein
LLDTLRALLERVPLAAAFEDPLTLGLRVLGPVIIVIVSPRGSGRGRRETEGDRASAQETAEEGAPGGARAERFCPLVEPIRIHGCSMSRHVPVSAN